MLYFFVCCKCQEPELVRKFHLLFGLLRLKHPLRCAELASIDRKADEISFKGNRHLQFGILLSECGCMFILQTRERGKMLSLFFPLLSNMVKKQADCPLSERSRMLILQVRERGEMCSLFFPLLSNAEKKQADCLLSERSRMLILQVRERGEMCSLFFPLLSNAEKKQADCLLSERSRMFILQVREKGKMRSLFFAFQYIYKFFTGNIGVHPNPLQLIQTLRQTLDNLVHPLIHRNGHIKTCFTCTCVR